MTEIGTDESRHTIQFTANGAPWDSRVLIDGVESGWISSIKIERAQQRSSCASHRTCATRPKHQPVAMYIQRWIKRDQCWRTVADITHQIAGTWNVIWRTGVAVARYQTLDALRACHDIPNVQRVIDGLG